MTMIASVLHLDRKAIRALRINDAYSLHRVVYSLYPDIRNDEQKNGSTASGILYADQGGDVHGRKIIMLANREPAHQVEGQFGQVNSKVIPDNFLDHGNYNFKVIINPTRRDNASRKLIAIRGRNGIAQWFCERSEINWGFTTARTNLQIDKIDILKFSDKKKNPVTISQAHIQGQLSVANKEKFIESFTYGIGRARAYGCGLLQIVPTINNPFC